MTGRGPRLGGVVDVPDALHQIDHHRAGRSAHPVGDVVGERVGAAHPRRWGVDEGAVGVDRHRGSQGRTVQARGQRRGAVDVAVVGKQGAGDEDRRRHRLRGRHLERRVAQRLEALPHHHRQVVDAGDRHRHRRAGRRRAVRDRVAEGVAGHRTGGQRLQGGRAGRIVAPRAVGGDRHRRPLGAGGIEGGHRQHVQVRVAVVAQHSGGRDGERRVLVGGVAVVERHRRVVDAGDVDRHRRRVRGHARRPRWCR